MKVAYLDLNYTQPVFEKYNIVSPSKYGGWRSIFSYFKEFPNCYLISREESFNEIDSRNESRDNLLTITKNESDWIKLGNPIKNISSVIGDFDLIIHPHVSEYFNFQGIKVKQVAIDLGVYQKIQANHKYILQYSKEQLSEIPNKDAQIFYFQLGIPIPEVFKPTPKEDFIFCCSRLCKLMNSIEIANFCRSCQIKGIFAGPIYPDYPFMDAIDNKYTFYLGEISNDTKNYHLRRARLSPHLISWPSPFSLGALEALSMGCPIAVARLGNFWPTLIKENINGFYASDNQQLLNAYGNSFNIDPRECYKASLKYNHHTMLSTLFEALEQIHKCN